MKKRYVGIIAALLLALAVPQQAQCG